MRTSRSFPRPRSVSRFDAVVGRPGLRAICHDGAKIDPVLRPGARGVLELPTTGPAGGADGREGLIHQRTGPEVFPAMGVTTSRPVTRVYF
jgi:hypothetical protein